MRNESTGSQLNLYLSPEECDKINHADFTVIPVEQVINRLNWISSNAIHFPGHCFFDVALTFVDVGNRFFISFGEEKRSMAVKSAAVIDKVLPDGCGLSGTFAGIVKIIEQILLDKCGYTCTVEDRVYILTRIVNGDFGVFCHKDDFDYSQPRMTLHMYLPTSFVKAPPGPHRPHFVETWDKIAGEIAHGFDLLSSIVIKPLVARFGTT